MEKSSEVSIAEIQVILKRMEEDIRDIKKSLKTEYQTKESANAIEERVEKLEEVQNKIFWAVILSVIGAILSLVLKVV